MGSEQWTMIGGETTVPGKAEWSSGVARFSTEVVAKVSTEGVDHVGLVIQYEALGEHIRMAIGLSAAMAKHLGEAMIEYAGVVARKEAQE